jgi:hypothetical protein
MPNKYTKKELAARLESTPYYPMDHRIISSWLSSGRSLEQIINICEEPSFLKWLINISNNSDLASKQVGDQYNEALSCADITFREEKRLAEGKYRRSLDQAWADYLRNLKAVTLDSIVEKEVKK